MAIIQHLEEHSQIESAHQPALRFTLELHRDIGRGRPVKVGQQQYTSTLIDPAATPLEFDDFVLWRALVGHRITRDAIAR